jgi:hypothetical protein
VWAREDTPDPSGFSVVRICDLDGLLALRAALDTCIANVGGRACAGIDVEWRPHTLCKPPGALGLTGRSWPASLLQICLHRHVFLVDLLELYAGRCVEVDAAFINGVTWLLSTYVVGVCTGCDACGPNVCASVFSVVADRASRKSGFVCLGTSVSWLNRIRTGSPCRSPWPPLWT